LTDVGSAASSATSTFSQAISFSRLVIGMGVVGTPLRCAVCALINTRSAGNGGRNNGASGGLPDYPPSQ